MRSTHFKAPRATFRFNHCDRLRFRGLDAVCERVRTLCAVPATAGDVRAAHGNFNALANLSVSEDLRPMLTAALRHARPGACMPRSATVVCGAALHVGSLPRGRYVDPDETCEPIEWATLLEEWVCTACMAGESCATVASPVVDSYLGHAYGAQGFHWDNEYSAKQGVWAYHLRMW